MHYITNLIVKIFKKNENGIFSKFFAKLLHIPKLRVILHRNSRRGVAIRFSSSVG